MKVKIKNVRTGEEAIFSFKKKYCQYKCITALDAVIYEIYSYGSDRQYAVRKMAEIRRKLGDGILIQIEKS